MTIDSAEYTLSSNDFVIDIPKLVFYPEENDSFVIQAFMEVSQEYKEIPAQLGVLSDDTTSLMINSIEDSYIGLHRIKITYTGIDLMFGQTFEESFTLTVL